jgi:hypothetical protein
MEMEQQSKQGTIGQARRAECVPLVNQLSRAACYHLLSWTDIAAKAHKPNGDDPLRLLRSDILAYVERGVLRPEDVRAILEKDSPEQWALLREAMKAAKDESAEAASTQQDLLGALIEFVDMSHNFDQDADRQIAAYERAEAAIAKATGSA